LKGRQVSETYGDVTAEYLAVRNGAGLIAGRHDLVSVQGPDAESFLQNIISQDLAALPEGGVGRSLLLGPEGKLRAVLWVLKGDNEMILVSDQGRGELLAGELGRYRFRVDAVIEPDASEVLALAGPSSSTVLQQAELPNPAGWERSGDTLVASLPLGGLARYLVVGVDREDLERAGARPVGSLAFDAVRIEAGEPVMGRDLDEKTIPQESGLVPEAVSFTKGCYLGQELVARIDSRGHVNRVLRGIVVGTNVLPPENAELFADGAPVGRITSLAESLTLRAPVGLALVRREVEPGSRVEIRWEGGSAGAVVRQLPLTDFTES
jgi:folate-binding protein YgfZ